MTVKERLVQYLKSTCISTRLRWMPRTVKSSTIFPEFSRFSVKNLITTGCFKGKTAKYGQFPNPYVF